MDPKESARLLAWAKDGNRSLHYAFAMARSEGILNLSKYHKGKAILHDLMKTTDDLDLRTRRFGTLSISSDRAAVVFTANKDFGSREQRSLSLVLETTRLRSYELVFAPLGGDDGAE